MRQITTTLRTALALLALACLQGGCTPELDWRELHSAEGRFKVLMPARATAATGDDGAGHVQALWTAETGSALFSVGYTDYRDAAQEHLHLVRNALLKATRGKLLTESETLPPQQRGLSITIQGLAADGSDRVVQAWLFPRGARLYQLAVAAKPGKVGATDTDMFLLSFRPD